MSAANIRFMGFGLLVAFAASFGQTYVFGVLQPFIRADYGLSEASFARLYLIITLGSAVGVSYFGSVIDRMDLRRYVLFLSAGMTLALIGMAFLQPIALLFAAMLATRMVGQGLMVHASMTSMSRYFDKARGSAVAVASAGISIGQALFPMVLVALITVMSWRDALLVMTGGFVVLVLPLMLFCLIGHDKRHADWLMREEARANAEDDNQGRGEGRSLRRRDMLRDWRFYAIIPTQILAPFWVTGVFFFADRLAALRGLSLIDLTATYSIYAAAATVTPFIVGAMVDRFAAVRLIWLPAVAMTLALGLLLETSIPIPLFMVFFGIAGMVNVPIMNALWAELYGTRYLGEIKGLANAIAVVSTSLSPFLLGEGLTNGFDFETLLAFSYGHMAISIVLAITVWRAHSLRVHQ